MANQIKLFKNQLTTLKGLDITIITKPLIKIMSEHFIHYHN